jgi:hypothetical protein
MEPDFFNTDSERRFSVGERVRLLREVHGLAAGCIGVVIGFYARAHQTIAVRFDSGVVELEPDWLASADLRPDCRTDTR